jgi:hypothetical protein
MGRRKFDEEVWLKPEDLARLEGISGCTVRWRCRHGVYGRIKKVRGRGGDIKGKGWLISLFDPAVSGKARNRYHLTSLIIGEGEKIMDANAKAVLRELTGIKNLLVSIREDLG